MQVKSFAGVFLPCVRRVAVFKIDPATGERIKLLTTAIIGNGGWVDLPGPITVRAGEAFLAVPEPERGRRPSP